MKTAFVKIRVDVDNDYDAAKLVQKWLQDGEFDQRIGEIIVEGI